MHYDVVGLGNSRKSSIIGSCLFNCFLQYLWSIYWIFFIQEWRCILQCIFTSQSAGLYTSLHSIVHLWEYMYILVHLYIYLFCIVQECYLMSQRTYDTCPFETGLFHKAKWSPLGISLLSVVGSHSIEQMRHSCFIQSCVDEHLGCLMPLQLWIVLL